MSTTMTCHCGAKFELPAEMKERRANCPSCGSVFFIPEAKAPGSEEDDTDTYGVAEPKTETLRAKATSGVEGIPDWLDRYRTNQEIKKADRDKTLEFIKLLAGADAVRDPLGATMFLAATHADAETSIAALAKVAMSRHPVYSPVALMLLEYISPSDAGGAQQVLVLLGETKDAAAEPVLVKTLRRLGPTPVAHVGSLVELLGSKHTPLYFWAVHSLKLIGPPARKGVDALLKTLKIGNRDLRLAVIDALGRIARDPEHVLPILLQALKHQEADYRLHAALALGHYGAAAAKAVPLLKEALKDTDAGVVKAAGEALRDIGAAMQSTSGSTPATAPAEGKEPEPLLVVCGCGKRLRVKAIYAGKKVKCPACGGVAAVPGAPVHAPSPPPAAAPPAGAIEEKECPVCQATIPAVAVLCVCCGCDFRALEPASS